MSASWPWVSEFQCDHIYLNTASIGLPPRRTVDALEEDMQRWITGAAQADDYDSVVDGARTQYAQLMGVSADQVAVGHQTSPLVGLIAAAVPDGARIVVADGDFTSVTYPFAVQESRGISLTAVPVSELAEALDETVWMVAFSAVQSATGEIADLDAICAAAQRHGVRTLCDLTQAAGWLPVDAGRFDWTVCSGYKWLLAPRGSAFLTVRPERLNEVIPGSAGWFAGQDRWQSIYTLPPRLASTARRFDVSPGWMSWVGTHSSLDFLAHVGVPDLYRHAIACEAAFSVAAELEPTSSAIRSLTVGEEGAALLDRAGVSAAMRAGKLRLSFHVSTTEEQAHEVGTLLRGHVSSNP